MATINVNSHLNLGQNQILGLVLENLATAPSTPVAGQLYFNTTDNEAYKWSGTEWLILGNLSNSQIRALLSGTNGITYNSTTGVFSADVDDVSIQIGAGGLEVKDGGVGTTELADDSVTKAKVNADVAGIGLAQNVDGSLEVDFDTVGVQLAGNGLTYDADNDVINVEVSSYKETIGDGATTSFTITHALNSQDVLIEVLDITNNYAPVVVEKSNPTVDTCQIDVNSAPSTNQYRVIIRKY